MDEKSCLSRLQKLCSKAEYCTSDIYRKAMRDLGSDAGAAARVVSALVEEGYLDEERYARAFAREKAVIQGWGPHKIRFQLRAKAVPEETIDAALAQLDVGGENVLVLRFRVHERHPKAAVHGFSAVGGDDVLLPRGPRDLLLHFHGPSIVWVEGSLPRTLLRCNSPRKAVF